MKYDIKEQLINSIIYVNSENELLNGKYIINGNNFHTVDNEYIFPLMPYKDLSKESKYLSVFTINKNKPNELVLKEIVDNKVPNNYMEYNLNHNFHTYRFDKSLILLHFGEFVYDYIKKVKYKIPFPKSEFDTLNNIISDALKTGKISSYYICDIFNNDEESLFLLYKDSSKNLKQMEINKKTDKILKDYIILTADELKDYKNNSSFTFNEKGEILYLNNDNCILKL